MNGETNGRTIPGSVLVGVYALNSTGGGDIIASLSPFSRQLSFNAPVPPKPRFLTRCIPLQPIFFKWIVCNG